MTARALDGRPSDVVLEAVNCPGSINLLNDSNATREIFGVITNLSRPDAGNYTYPLL